MDSLVDIRFKRNRIEVLPSSIVQYCTNLVSIDLSNCENLTSIEVDFCCLKNLKKLYLLGCIKLRKAAQHIFNADFCLHQMHRHPMHRQTPFVNSYFFSFLPFPRFLTRLSILNSPILVNGDIPFNICELSSLQVLDLSDNSFSRIQFNLVQLPRLKYLNISNCNCLSELLDLPQSISVLEAFGCDSLRITEDFPTTYKWLWKVRLGDKVPGGENIIRSMFQGNAINEDHFISFRKKFDISKMSFARETFMLQLPWNWYNDYGGFLISVVQSSFPSMKIVIKQEKHTNYQSCLLEEYDRTKIQSMCYIPFSSLMHKSLWNGNISFFIFKSFFKVELVPRRSNGGSLERSTDCSEFWDEQEKDRKTFTVQHASWNSVEIRWSY